MAKQRPGRRARPASGWWGWKGLCAVGLACAAGWSLLPRRPAPASDLYGPAVRRARAGDVAGAIGLLEPAADRLDPAGLQLLGGLYGNAGRLDLSARALRAALALRPDSGELWSDVALTLTRAGDRQGALEATRAAADASPADAGRLYAVLVSSLHRRAFYAECAAAGSEALKRGAVSANVYQYTGWALLELARYSEASLVLEGWRSWDNRSWERHRLLFPVTVGVDRFSAAVRRIGRPAGGQLARESQPAVWRLAGLLSADECAQLVRAVEPIIATSEVGTSGQAQRHSTRRSASAAVGELEEPDRSQWMGRLAEVLGEVVGLPAWVVQPGIDAHVVQYIEGQFYADHYDSSPVMRRAVSLLVLLDDGFEGGETGFPAAGSQQPQQQPCERRVMHSCFVASPEGELCRGGVQLAWRERGDGLLWYNHLDDGEQDPYAMHAGCPVTRGQKWMLNIWLRLTDEVIEAIEQ